MRSGTISSNGASLVPLHRIKNCISWSTCKYSANAPSITFCYKIFVILSTSFKPEFLEVRKHVLFIFMCWYLKQTLDMIDTQWPSFNCVMLVIWMALPEMLKDVVYILLTMIGIHFFPLIMEDWYSSMFRIKIYHVKRSVVI